MIKQQEQLTPTPMDRPQDLLCFCHLRWDFVYQRPQHIMTRMARQYRVFFVEEHIFHNGADIYKVTESGAVRVVRLLLNDAPSSDTIEQRQQQLLDGMMKEYAVRSYISWYYTPMALKFTRHLQPAYTIYDCMDELSAFKFAPQEMRILEAALLKKASLVLTGGHSLYQAKKHTHSNIHPFPSSIEKEHFAKGRTIKEEPADQQQIPEKRIGFYGVIDERFDIGLVEAVARRRPDWQLVLIGPVVKIDEATLPRLQNIHYLGCKNYQELPQYLSGWDIAMIPFERNESTQFISPTKTPEYLAAGCPVISTSITDVVNPYYLHKLVHIADDADKFIAAAEREFALPDKRYTQWLKRVDRFLENVSWDYTTRQMQLLMDKCYSTAGLQPKTTLKSVA
ncbi:MAG: glycosyltransferase family 1 protein [Chitinophagaceae bacterium]|nr:MAG: glycosyltransferase family 1 protein [Chitinophagaceae bacterium]